MQRLKERKQKSVEFQRAETMKREAAEEQRWSNLVSELSNAQASLHNQVTITNGGHDGMSERVENLESELSRAEKDLCAAYNQQTRLD